MLNPYVLSPLKPSLKVKLQTLSNEHSKKAKPFDIRFVYFVDHIQTFLCTQVITICVHRGNFTHWVYINFKLALLFRQLNNNANLFF